MRKLRLFKSIIKNGLQGIMRNLRTGLATTASISAVLLLLGLIFLLVLNISFIVEQSTAKIDKLIVFLDDDIKTEEVEKIINAVNNFDEIKSIIYVSRAEALEKGKEMLGDYSDILDALPSNPYPASFNITLDNIDKAQEVVDSIKDFKGIEEIRYHKDAIEKMVGANKFIKVGGAILMLGLIGVSTFIISNTVKTVLAARRNEVEIMRYIGATNGFIKGPFIFEGLFFALVGAILACVLLFVIYNAIFESMNPRLYESIKTYMIKPQQLYMDISIIFLAIGFGVGSIGSIWSLRKYLKA
ncbi:MAG: permease-like cell division protein FtsX [Tissierellia bacterium]|nr:permease-like cell division protein FtsX [Tissierellia bacterium]